MSDSGIRADKILYIEGIENSSYMCFNDFVSS